jgi:hypothetical protein
VSHKRDAISQATNTLTKKNPLSEFLVARSKDLIAVLVISSRLGSLELSRSNCDGTWIRRYMPVNTSATCLVTHVIGSEQTEVGLGSMFRVTALKVVELGTICEGIVAILSRKSKDVGVVRPAGTFGGVREEESHTTSKEDISNWPEWSSADEVFCDD